MRTLSLLFSAQKRAGLFLLMLSSLLLFACTKSGEKSRKAAVENVATLVKVVQADVAEVRSGLPKGALRLIPFMDKAGIEPLDYQTADRALRDARGHVEELRHAKSNFFLIAQKDGLIMRNNLEQDDMAGERLFTAYPNLKKVLQSEIAEVQGNWRVARGVNGRPDAQWVAAVPIKNEQNTIGVYATGWSWSGYAERLESRLRDQVLKTTKPGENVPLIYLYILVEGAAYGAPIAPMLNIEKFLETQPLGKVHEGKLSETAEILGTSFGIALEQLPAFDGHVSLVVFRSET